MLGKMKKWARFLKKHRNQIIFYGGLLLLMLVLVSLFFDFVKMMIIVIVFSLINCFLRFYKRIFPGIPIELEISIFSTVLCSIAFGLWAGILVALISSIASEFFTQMIKPYSLVNVIVYALIPFFAIFLTAEAVAGAGLIITVVANIVIFLLFAVLGYDVVRNAAYSITNIIFNYFIFTYLGVAVLALIS